MGGSGRADEDASRVSRSTKCASCCAATEFASDGRDADDIPFNQVGRDVRHDIVGRYEEDASRQAQARSRLT